MTCGWVIEANTRNSKLESVVPTGNIPMKHADLGPVWVITISYVLSWRYISDSRLLQERKCIHYSGGVTVEAGLEVAETWCSYLIGV